MTPVIRTIEIGFGTTSFIVDDELNVVTFKSLVHPVDEHKRDITSGAMNATGNVVVCVSGSFYEVGPDVDKVFDPRNNRVLNSNYINSDQYKALFLGALSMMDVGPDNTIDFLVGGLPVSNMHRSKELIAFMEGEHNVGGRIITVKKAWAAAQPLGGLLAYANSQGMDFLKNMPTRTILTIDPGYLTVDYLTTTGMHASDSRSGAIDKGMSKVIEAVADLAATAFGAAKIYNEAIDRAFYGKEKAIKFKGRLYPFPVCNGQDIFDEPSRIKFNFSDAISRITKEACSEIQNAVGDAQDVDLILLVGGPAPLYLPNLKETFPDHRIVVVENHLQAVCVGLHVAGTNKFRRHLSSKATA
jgi:plasmid segregation protein ParM